VELLVEIGNMLKLLCFPIRSKPREVFPQPVRQVDWHYVLRKVGPSAGKLGGE
jgi:hypothetical protein